MKCRTCNNLLTPLEEQSLGNLCEHCSDADAASRTLRALRLLNTYTHGSLDIFECAGRNPVQMQRRQQIMSALTGRKATQAKSRVNAIRSAFYTALHAEGDCLVAMQDDFYTKSRQLLSPSGPENSEPITRQPSAASPNAGVIQLKPTDTTETLAELGDYDIPEGKTYCAKCKRIFPEGDARLAVCGDCADLPLICDDCATQHAATHPPDAREALIRELSLALANSITALEYLIGQRTPLADADRQCSELFRRLDALIAAGQDNTAEYSRLLWELHDATRARLTLPLDPREALIDELAAALIDLRPYVESCVDRSFPNEDDPATKDLSTINAALARATAHQEARHA